MPLIPAEAGDPGEFKVSQHYIVYHKQTTSENQVSWEYSTPGAQGAVISTQESHCSKQSKVKPPSVPHTLWSLTMAVKLTRFTLEIYMD